MSTEQILERLRSSANEIAETYHARVTAIFGSYARREQRRGSDLDLLYEVLDKEKFGFLEACGLEDFILLNVDVPSVDLVDRAYLNPIVELEIQDELVYV